MSNINELLKVVNDELAKVKLGEMFLILDLFKGYGGSSISRSDIVLFGTLFCNFIRDVDADVDIFKKHIFLTVKI